MHATKGEIVLIWLGGETTRVGLCIGNNQDGELNLIVFGEGSPEVPAIAPVQEPAADKEKPVTKPKVPAEPASRIVTGVPHKSAHRSVLFPYWEHRRLQ